MPNAGINHGNKSWVCHRKIIKLPEAIKKSLASQKKQVVAMSRLELWVAIVPQPSNREPANFQMKDRWVLSIDWSPILFHLYIYSFSASASDCTCRPVVVTNSRSLQNASEGNACLKRAEATLQPSAKCNVLRRYIHQMTAARLKLRTAVQHWHTRATYSATEQWDFG